MASTFSNEILHRFVASISFMLALLASLASSFFVVEHLGQDMGCITSLQKMANPIRTIHSTGRVQVNSALI